MNNRTRVIEAKSSDGSKRLTDLDLDSAELRAEVHKLAAAGTKAARPPVRIARFEC
jgi:hypothetical protein